MDSKKDLSPNIQRAKDLHDVEMIGNPTSPKLGVKPDVHIANEKKNNPAPSIPSSEEQPPHKDSDAQPLLEPSRGRQKPPLAAPPIPSSEEQPPHKDSDAQPLLEPSRGRQKPPLAGPEIDDLDGDERPTDAEPYPGIDDGLLEPGDDRKHNGPGHPEGHDGDGDSDGDADKEKPPNGDGILTDDGNWWPHDEPDFPYDGINGFGTRSNFDPDRPISPMMPGSIPDVNTYQQKKNLAQGMMDLALLSANANQLRYVLESSSTHPYFYPSLAFISLSIILQIAVGVGLIMNSRYNVKDDKDICKADKINNMTVLGVFLVTIVNVFITSFSVATPNVSTVAMQTDIQGG